MKNQSVLGTALGMALMMFAPGALAGDGALPSVDQVIEQHLRAVGGRTALRQSGMLVLSGQLNSSEQSESGSVEISISTPRVYLDHNAPHDRLQMGYTGQAVWRQEGSNSVEQRPGRQFAELVTVFDPARALWWKEWYPEIAVKGIEKIGGREAYVLETHPGSPTTERIYVDRQSGLLVRDQVMPKVVFIFSDYRIVDSVEVPFTVIQTTPNEEVKYTYQFREAKRVAEVEASRFEPR